MAATVLINRPRKVSTLGEMRVSASPSTMYWRMTPQPLPKALVHVMSTSLSRSWCLVVNGGQLENLQLPFAVWSHNRSDVSDLLTDQSPADGRRGGDQALVHVGFFAGDQLVGDLFVFGDVEDHYRGAKCNPVLGNIGQVDQGEFPHTLLELPQPGVDEDLALLRHVILGVLAQIAQRSSLLDLDRQVVGELVLQLAYLFFQFFLYVFWHLAIDPSVAEGPGRASSNQVKTRLYDGLWPPFQLAYLFFQFFLYVFWHLAIDPSVAEGPGRASSNQVKTRLYDGLWPPFRL